MITQDVDPLVTQAIKEAVEKEGWQQWAFIDSPPLPKYKPISSEMKPAPKRAFFSELLP